MEVISVGSVVKDNVNQGILYFCIPVAGEIYLLEQAALPP